MGNKIYCENFNSNLKNLNNEKIIETNSNTKIIFWKINTNFFQFNFFNKNSQEISEINLFDYFNETKNDDNIYLIGILTKKNNFIDLNKIFNIDLANKHLMFIKHMNDDLNQIRISFFFFCNHFEKNNFFNINNKYIKYIESIKNVPNFFMLLYSNANEEIDLKKLQNFNLNSKNFIVKILTQIILDYININNNNNNNENKIPDIPISSILNKKTFNSISITKKDNFTLLSAKTNTNNTNIFNNKIINHININNNNQKIKDLIEEDDLILNQNLQNENYIEEEEEFEEKNNFIPLPSSRTNRNKQDYNNINYEEEEEEDFYPPESSFRMNNNNDYSEILENFLYLGNYKIANDISRLNKIGIEYIINLCQDICNNINDKKIKFLSFNMKDSTKENIECIFYKCFDFINKCKSENKKILIHCYQGISRSACLVTAYLIFSKKIDSDKAFNFVQKKRKIANPNLGFFFQLNVFYNRITMKKNHLNVYAISSFQIEQPNLIVCRLIYHNMILNPENINNIKPLPIFDERGIFILGDFNNVVILIGNKIFNSCKEIYLNTAKNYYEKYLNVYENINIKKNDVIIVHQNEMKNNKILNDLLEENKVNINFGINKELDNFYIDLNNIENININNNKIDDENEKIKKLFYFYPNKEGFKVLNLEDLSENELLFACYENNSNKIIYIWKGKNVNINKNEEDNYKNLIKSKFFNDDSNIIEKIENPLEETEEFLNLI
jgi:protein-tyrosine phosphatase